MRVPYEEDAKKTLLNKKLVLNVAIALIIFGGGFFLGDKKDEILQQAKYGQAGQNLDLAGQLDLRGVDELYDQLKMSFDGELKPSELEEGLKEGLVKAAGDPFTEYLNEQATKEFEEGLSGSFEGIGAELGKEGQAIVIISPIEGFPAEKAGLRAGDIIAEINGESAYDLTITEAVKRIRGPKGTQVTLGIVREGKPIEVKIRRAQIKIPSVESEMLKGNIGLIEISRFGEDTAQLAANAAQDLKSKGAKAVILDLRNNPGGLLDVAIDVSSLWLEEGSLIVEEKRGDTTIKTHRAEGNAILNGLPTVVLINEGSASASEIVAGALRDNKAATIIGQKSYGKGSVQEVITLEDGGSLKVTIARWFTPAGRNIDSEGIKPDQAVKLTEKDTASKRDPQKEAAIKRLL